MSKYSAICYNREIHIHKNSARTDESNSYRSAEAERRFSLTNNICPDERMSLSFKHISDLMPIYDSTARPKYLSGNSGIYMNDVI
jgi:hypothetical protein